MEKPCCSGERAIVVGTGVVVLDAHGRVLVGQRADTGLWGLPGGRLEFGETVKSCAQRELEEETGLQLPLSSFKTCKVVNCIRPTHHSVDFTVITVLRDSQQPSNREPTKCLGWHWKAWSELTLDTSYWPLADRLQKGLQATLAEYENMQELDTD